MDELELIEPMEGTPEEAMPPQEQIEIVDDDQVEVSPDSEELPSDEILDALLGIIEEYETEEQPIREAKIKYWKKFLCYWESMQYIFWDSVRHDFRTLEDGIEEQELDDEVDPDAYRKVFNIYKAHGSAIIAALSASVPKVQFFPDDADKAADISTAKAYTQLGKIVQKWNDAPLLLIKMIWLLWNQGFIAAQCHLKEDEEYGTQEKPVYGDVSGVNRQFFCPQCDDPLGQDELLDSDMEADPLSISAPMVSCTNCGYQGSADTESQSFTRREVVDTEEIPRSRVCVYVHGPLNVEVPLWVKDPKGMPYLTFKREVDENQAKEIFKTSRNADKIQGGVSDTEEYERWARLNQSYDYGFPSTLLTIRETWIRPWVFHKVGDEGLKAQLFALYPDGCCLVRANDVAVEVRKEKLDDYWVFLEDPTSQDLHGTPLGEVLMDPQDLTNEMVNITAESIEHGIPEVFYTPETLDGDAYKQQPSRPGMLTPAQPLPGRSLGDSFYEVKTATVSQEVDRFYGRLESAAQFVSGSVPSIYGGALSGGSGTAKEYELSRAQALQRLSTIWTFVKQFWTKMVSKATILYAQNLQGDERFVEKAGQDSFLNVWVYQRDLAGRVGRVEPMMDEQFPMSWGEKRDVILNLIQMGSEEINAMLLHPENIAEVVKYIGIPDLYIPGDDDRNKQLAEIAVMIMEQPIMGEPQIDQMTGEMVPGQEQPSVPVDPDLDNHQIESEVCKAWLKGDVGRVMKEVKPEGWRNIYLHMQQHEMMAQSQMQLEVQQQEQQMEEEENGSQEPGREA